MKLKTKINPEILILLFFAAFSLRPLTWFEPPNIFFSGDFRPPVLNLEAFLKRTTYLWDEVDYGIPSVYLPRILDPYNLLILTLRLAGLHQSLAQIVSTILVYFLTSTLTYLYVKKLLGERIVAFVAGAYITSNLYLINDREITAIGFPSQALIILIPLTIFLYAVRVDSYKLAALAGFLGIMTYAGFPNYRLLILCIIIIVLSLIYLTLEQGISFTKNKHEKITITIDLNLIYKLLKFLGIFFLSLIFFSIWIFAIVIQNFQVLSKVYETILTGPISFRSLDYKFYDIIRLIAEWGFYCNGTWVTFSKPYIPYRALYLNNPCMIILSYLPPFLAFFSIIFLRKHRKQILFFIIVAIFSLLLTAGSAQPFVPVYEGIVNLPLMKVFRESSNWVLIPIIAYGVLIGKTTSGLYKKFSKKRSMKIFALTFTILLLVLTTLPLFTGDVTKNWVNPATKGSLLPNSYLELNSLLKSNCWSILLPPRYDYVAYNFTTPFSSGNPYVLIFSKPIITGIGSEYVKTKNLNIIKYVSSLFQTKTSNNLSRFIGVLGIRQIIVEKNLTFGYLYATNEINLKNKEGIILIKDWPEVSLYENLHSQEKIYLADKILKFSTIEDMHRKSTLTPWNTLKHSVFIQKKINLTNINLTIPEKFYWKEINPTEYFVYVKSEKPFILVLLENYDKNWEVYINNTKIHEKNHFQVNAFANAWLIQSKGKLYIEIVYKPQKYLPILILTSILSPLTFLAIIERKTIKKFVKQIKEKYKSNITKI